MAATMMTSCFSTKVREEESSRQQQMAERFHKDSVWIREHTPDTMLVAFKRTMYCDGKQMVAFDRVTLLSGAEATEYSQRHNRFDSSPNVVVNKEIKLETLPLAQNVQMFLHDGDDDINDVVTETVLQIVIYNKSIIYLKETRYGN